MTSDGEVDTSEATTKTWRERKYTLSQIFVFLLVVGILCAVPGGILVVMVNTFYLSPQNEGSSIRTTQDSMMEDIRATLIVSTEQAFLAANIADSDSPLQMAKIHEFHELLRDGLYDQAWCIVGQANTPWPSSQGEFATYWDANPAYLSAPVFPIQGLPEWFLVRIRWENSGTEEQLRYRMTYGFQYECEGWIIAEVVPAQ